MDFHQSNTSQKNEDLEPQLIPPRVPLNAFGDLSSSPRIECLQQNELQLPLKMGIQPTFPELSPRRSLRMFASEVLSDHGKRIHSSIKRHSRSDYDIRRCSINQTNNLKVNVHPPATPKMRCTRGVVMERFRYICTIISFCLAEVLVVTGCRIALYVITARGVTDTREVELNTVHVLVGHLLLSPLMYSYGFAPIKNRIQRLVVDRGIKIRNYFCGQTINVSVITPAD